MRLSKLFVFLMMLLSLSACVKEEEFTDSPRGNFEALWRIIDEHYCFLDYKKAEYGLDWNEVYQRYQKQMHEGMTEKQLFEVLTNMLAELRDGHVNLYTSFNLGRNWSFYEHYPANVSDVDLEIEDYLITPMSSENTHSNMTFNFDARLSFTYQLGRYFLNAYGQFSNFHYRSNNVKGRLNDWFVNASLGVRL